MISPIEGPTVWKGADFAGKESVSLDLRDGHLAALGEAVESTAHLPVESLERAHFDDGQLQALMAEVRRELCEGRGLVIPFRKVSWANASVTSSTDHKTTRLRAVIGSAMS
jgi:hypothetical protein